MAYFHFIWTDEIIEHLAQNDVTPEDFENVVCHPQRIGASKSSGQPAAWGYTEDGRYIMAVYELMDEFTAIPVTAFEPKKRQTDD